MTNQEIQKLAGHREVPPWVMKLVGEAIAIEREACAMICDKASAASLPAFLAIQIRARGQE